MKIQAFGIRLEISTLSAIKQRRKEPTARIVQKPEEEASEEFWSAFQFGGTLVCTCRCGRTHFCSNTSLDYEEGELEDLIRNSVEEPDKFIQDDIDDSVAVIDGPNGLMVWGCPCHAAKPFENFLADYRRPILDYYARVLRSGRQDIEDAELALESALTPEVQP